GMGLLQCFSVPAQQCCPQPCRHFYRQQILYRWKGLSTVLKDRGPRLVFWSLSPFISFRFSELIRSPSSNSCRLLYLQRHNLLCLHSSWAHELNDYFDE